MALLSGMQHHHDELRCLPSHLLSTVALRLQGFIDACAERRERVPIATRHARSMNVLVGSQMVFLFLFVLVLPLAFVGMGEQLFAPIGVAERPLALVAAGERPEATMSQVRPLHTDGLLGLQEPKPRAQCNEEGSQGAMCGAPTGRKATRALHPLAMAFFFGGLMNLSAFKGVPCF